MTTSRSRFGHRDSTGSDGRGAHVLEASRGMGGEECEWETGHRNVIKGIENRCWV